MSDFEFRASNPVKEMKIPAEPHNKGGGGALEGKKWAVHAGVSFRDKVLGLQNVPQREKVDLVENKLVSINLVNGSRLLPMLIVDQKMVEELSQP